jgi:hypothetical protein
MRKGEGEIPQDARFYPSKEKLGSMGRGLDGNGVYQLRIGERSVEEENHLIFRFNSDIGIGQCTKRFPGPDRPVCGLN